MYFAGVIPDPKVISEADIAQELADMLELVKNAIHDAPEHEIRDEQFHLYGWSILSAAL